jgi:hypothetical protein
MNIIIKFVVAFIFCMHFCWERIQYIKVNFGWNIGMCLELVRLGFRTVDSLVYEGNQTELNNMVQFT